MVVDDQMSVLDVMDFILRSEGYVVKAYTNPLEAIEFYRANCSRIALVLLDYRMPEMRGDEVFARLKAINQDVRVLLETSHPPEELLRMRQDGLCGLILKPFHVDTIVTKIHELLDDRLLTE